MAVKISGVLKDGTGKPVQNCTIQLKAKRNSTTVVVNTLASENPDEAGRYSMDVEYGQYSVILLVEGFPPSHAGTITLAVSGAPAWASEHQSTLSAGYLHARTNVPGSDDLNGINVKYRYEFTDTLGLVTSFSYAGDKNRQLTRYSDTRWHEDSVRNRWFSVMAGPSVRVNEWFSAYAMAGVAYSRVSTFSGDYIRVTDNKGKTHDVLTGSDDGRHSNTSLAH
ncbi:outer membrane protein [Shigella sonnei]|nr:outer membrane protein [Shigella sonnei]CSU37200.1 outer membrane protein [Shigella sonnei]CTB73547.1 outer membrane protein [Shigella sonnei]